MTHSTASSATTGSPKTLFVSSFFSAYLGCSRLFWPQARLAMEVTARPNQTDDDGVVTMRFLSATSRNHPSLQTKVSFHSGPSDPHDDPGTQTTTPTTRVTSLAGETAAFSVFFLPGATVDALWAHRLAEQTACSRHKANIGAAHEHSYC
jgi:hypothetical protein